MPRTPENPEVIAPTKKLGSALRALADRRRALTRDPLDVLRDVRELRSELDAYTDVLVREALRLDYTWDEVAYVTGISRATWHRRLGAIKQGPRPPRRVSDD